MKMMQSGRTKQENNIRIRSRDSSTREAHLTASLLIDIERSTFIGNANHS